MMHAKIYLADGNTNNAAYCILEALGIQIAKNYNLSLDRKEANLGMHHSSLLVDCRVF